MDICDSVTNNSPRCLEGFCGFSLQLDTLISAERPLLLIPLSCFGESHHEMDEQVVNHSC